MRSTAKAIFTAVLFIGHGALAGEPITPIDRDHLVPLAIERIFNAQQWQFGIKHRELKSVTLRLLLGDEELLSLRMNNDGTDDAVRLDVVIDFQDAETARKWRFVSTLDNCRSLYVRNITFPEWATRRRLKRYAWGPAAAPRANRRYQMMDLEFEDARMRRTIPLYLQILLNEETAPTGGTSPTWPPIADPSLVEPPRVLTADMVAKAFDFPMTLRVHRATEWRGHDSPGIPLWSLSFSSEADAFAPVNIVAFHGGTFLTAEVEARVTAALNQYQASMDKLAREEEQRIAGIKDEKEIKRRKESLEQVMSRRRSDPPIRIIETSRGGRAYVQVLGFGPGGSALGFITRSPDGKQDVLICVSFSGEGKRVPVDTQETHDYYTRLKEHPFDVLQRAGIRITSELFRE